MKGKIGCNVLNRTKVEGTLPVALATLTIGDAAALAGVSAKVLRGWADSGRLASARTAGGHRRFRAVDVLRAATARDRGSELHGSDGLPVGGAASRGARPGSWVESVELFEAAAHWLTPAHQPQLRALYELAESLDEGAALGTSLVASFIRAHEALLERARFAGATESEGDLALAAIEADLGVWRA